MKMSLDASFVDDVTHSVVVLASERPRAIVPASEWRTDNGRLVLTSRVYNVPAVSRFGGFLGLAGAVVGRG